MHKTLRFLENSRRIKLIELRKDWGSVLGLDRGGRVLEAVLDQEGPKEGGCPSGQQAKRQKEHHNGGGRLTVRWQHHPGRDGGGGGGEGRRERGGTYVYRERGGGEGIKGGISRIHHMVEIS